uniref:ectonucleoside triphosphate diphosphohydrolase 2-like isoform X2 n=1 Tax=Myxine glutinosa TaxID=7769 RepID=UPI00358F5C92
MGVSCVPCFPFGILIQKVFLKRGMAKRNIFRRHPKTCLWLSLSAFVLALVGIVSVSVAWCGQPEPTAPPKYGIVIDAGSSHSKLIIYQWPGDKQNGTGIVTETSSCSVKGPGISSYEDDPLDAGASLKECLKKAEHTIDSRKHKDTPLFLGATAGMRLLQLKDSDKSKNILKAVEDEMLRSRFKFRHARILTGVEEGASGWITVNYIKKNFYKVTGPTWLPEFFRPDDPKTDGALDLGGASTQITFVPKDTADRGTMHLRLFGYDYNVYTHSFLCYGRDQASYKLLDHLIQMNYNETQGTASNPCLNEGFSFTKRMDFIYESPCTASSAPAWYKPDKTVTFVGTGNSNGCRAAVETLFNLSSCSENPECSFNGVYQPNVFRSYMAFAAFYYTISGLNLTSEEGMVQLEEFENGLAEFCNKTWQEIKLQEPKQKDERLREVCFNGHLVHTLLLAGYKFDGNSFENIRFLKKVNGMSLGWTLGFMLNQTNNIPAEEIPPKALPLEGVILLLLLFSVLLLLALAACFLLHFRGSPSPANSPTSPTSTQIPE